jgi:hypothetical protein
LACIALLASVMALPLQAEVAPLTLYQRCGRSPWIIIGTVADHDDRLARIKVVEVLKGSYDSATLRVVHRLENFLRERWEGKIEFGPEEQVVLFLKRYDPEETQGTRIPRKLRAPDVFASSFGAQGVFALPAEGQEAYVEAVRAFAAATALEDPTEQEETVLGFLQSANPHILQAGLEQVLDRQLALPEHVTVLMRLVDYDREPVRLNALQVLEQVAGDLESSGRVLPNLADIVDRLKAKVLGSDSDLFRAESLKAVISFAGAAEAEFLRRLSREDPSQLVRYQASRGLVELGE